MRLATQGIIEKKAVKRLYKTLMGIGLLLFLLAISYIILFPLFRMISDALTPESEFYDTSVVWLPKHPTFDNLKNAFKMLKLPASLMNTFIYQMISALMEIVVCSIVAYGLARFDFFEKKLLEAFLMLTILVPLPMLMIPMSVNYSHLDFLGILRLLGSIFNKELRPNLLNTGFSFWLPSVLGVGLKSGILIYIFRQFYRNIPHELEEAAFVDGAGPARTYFSIVVPSSGVVFLTVSIFAVIWHWNDTYMPTMFLRENYPLSVSLSMISTELVLDNKTGYGAEANGIIMAGCILFILPMLVLYLLLQNKFIKSIDRVGIVG